MPRRPSRRPRRAPQQARSRALVEAVVEATAQLLVTEGPATTIARIAERAGVSVGSIYQYFGGKDAVVAAVAERHIARLAAAARTIDLDSPPEEAMRSAVEAVLAVERVDPRLGSVLNQLGHGGRSTALVASFEEGMEQLAIATIATRMARGELRQTDPERAGRVLIRALSGVVRATLLTEPERVTEDAFVDELVLLARGYLLAEPA